MKIIDHTFILRLIVAVILLVHSVTGMFDNGIHDFGKFYLDEQGFAPYGVALAWAIKLSHIVAALCLLLNRFIKPAAIVTIFILISGIVMLHFKEGWFVVGGGRNGMEFNLLLIAVLLFLMFPNGLKRSATRNP